MADAKIGKGQWRGFVAVRLGGMGVRRDGYLDVLVATSSSPT